MVEKGNALFHDPVVPGPDRVSALCRKRDDVMLHPSLFLFFLAGEMRETCMPTGKDLPIPPLEAHMNHLTMKAKQRKREQKRKFLDKINRRLMEMAADKRRRK